MHYQIKNIQNTFKKGLSISLIALKGLVPAVAPVTAATISAFLMGCPEPKPKVQNPYDENGFHFETGLHKDTNELWNPQGYDRDGIRLFVDLNNDGFDDISGFDRYGWKLESDGRYTWQDTGKEYNPSNGKRRDGSIWRDANGWDWRGWNEDGIHKNTGKTYDNNSNDINGNPVWVDKAPRDGYNDITGKDINGDNRINPIVGHIMSTADTGIPRQNTATSITSSNRGRLNTMASNVNNQFNEFYNESTGPLELKNNVTTACEKILNNYIVTIGNLLPSNKKSDFMNLINAYRAQAYVNYRAYGNNATDNPTMNELEELYEELATMNVTAGNIETFFAERVIPDLSTTLRVSPGLIESLINQIKVCEQFYAIRDDIRAAGFAPVTEAYAVDSYVQDPEIPIRNQAYINNLIHEAQLQYD